MKIVGVAFDGDTCASKIMIPVNDSVRITSNWLALPFRSILVVFLVPKQIGSFELLQRYAIRFGQVEFGNRPRVGSAQPNNVTGANLNVGCSLYH